MKRRTSRRSFMKNTALVGAGVWLVGDYRKTQAQSPNEKIRVASIGVKGKGDSDSKDAGKLGELVALCDIDDNRLQQQAAEFKMAAKYNDYRKMLEEMGDKIDAVTVSTPDHTHAPAALMAMRMKKHAFVQKPLTHTVHEARLMRETAAKMGVKTQMGNQGTANTALRSAAVAVEKGMIGNVTEAHVWTNRPIWAQGGNAPKDMPECPKHIHWDLWLGPAKERPYHPAYLPFAWRGWWDFGTGALGDMACHTANMPFMALKLGYPTSIVAETPEINPDSYPKSSKITFEFPAREGMPACKMVWYDGGQKPSPEVMAKVGDAKYGNSGSLLIGDKGCILAGKDDYCGSYQLLPEADFKDVKQPEPKAKSPGHMQEWFDAMKGGPAAWSNFDYAAYLTEVILLGNVAMRVGKKVEWDGPNMKSTNCPEAAQYVKKEYRKGFEVEV